MKIMSSFTHPHIVPNLYECLCSAEHKGRYSEECVKQSSSRAPLTSMVFSFPTMEVNGAPKQPGYKLSSKYLPLCSAEQRHSSKWRQFFIFGWTIPLTWLRFTWFFMHIFLKYHVKMWVSLDHHCIELYYFLAHNKNYSALIVNLSS